MVKHKLISGIFLFLSFLLTVFLILGYYSLFGAMKFKAPDETFVVPVETEEQKIISSLKEQGFIRGVWPFNFVLTLKGKHQKIAAGGYYLSKSMNVWQLADKLTSEPDMKWVLVKEGMRKEQIGEILAKTLGWSGEELDKWNTVYTRMSIDYIEGVYFPDTYLIPVKEDGLAIARRMTGHFNEKFAPFSEQFAKQDVLWTTGLKIASLIQRETADKADMPIISGVIWNRLNQGMKLEIDATIQYAKGKVGDSWWAPVTGEDVRGSDSPYNTYKIKGLPPNPICNPGLDALSAAANPADTDCIFYLHGNDKVMHCAKTYEEHLQNIEKYLD